MSLLFSETIFALSSGHLPSGVAIVRVSGTQARVLLRRLAGFVPPDRTAAYTELNGGDGRLLDRALVLFFSGPKSFTGEDCAEFHLHGGRAVVSALLAELGSVPDVRQADAGEFTKRAFLNGKIDLTEAEALADLIGAETESQRQLAALNAGGAQHALYESWRGRLLHARAMIEAELDFSDESDVPGSVSGRIWADMRLLHGDIGSHIGGFSRAEMIRDGVSVVILGAPNAGKSSLINALAQRDVAIVSDEPGTTRDLVEVVLNLDGLKVIVTDTAGIRARPEKVEEIGIVRARDRAREAHLVLLVTDASQPLEIEFDAQGVPVLSVGAKADLPSAPGRYDLLLSVADGRGLGELLTYLSDFARKAAGYSGETLPSRVRHVQNLEQCRGQIEIALARSGMPIELRAEHLRNAANALARISGRLDIEDLLGTIFAEFCIGK